MQHLAPLRVRTPNVATAQLELIYFLCDDEGTARLGNLPARDKKLLNLNEVAFPLDQIISFTRLSVDKSANGSCINIASCLMTNVPHLCVTLRE